MKNVVTKNALLLAAVAGLVGVGFHSSAQTSVPKSCFVYVGPVGDIGWTFAHNEARLLTEKVIPGLETKFVESVPEAQAMPTIDKLVSDGCKVVFTTSFGFMDQTLEAAKKYPDVIFAHTSGYKRAPNVAN